MKEVIQRPSRDVVRFPATRLTGLALARNNGRVAAECEVPLPRGNPYRKGSRKHVAFMEGYDFARSALNKDSGNVQ